MVKAAQTNEEDIPRNPVAESRRRRACMMGLQAMVPWITIPAITVLLMKISVPVPVVPLPNPGEGGPVYSGPDQPTGLSAAWDNPETLRYLYTVLFPSNGSITIFPGISFPCYNCTTSSRLGRIRILNASSGYPAFNVSLGNWRIGEQLDNGDLTSYVQASSGSDGHCIRYERLYLCSENGHDPVRFSLYSSYRQYRRRTGPLWKSLTFPAAGRPAPPASAPATFPRILAL